MRLWHYQLLQSLPSRQLLGLHRECCALRGLAWGRKHKTVEYVFRYPRSRLFAYHILVMDEMARRGYRADQLWRDPLYRGKRAPMDKPEALATDMATYPEHDADYLQECLENLKRKGIDLSKKL